MKTLVSVLALSGALMLSGVASSAQANPLTDPHANQYSWGVIVSPSDGPTQSFTNADLGKAAAAQARSVGQMKAAADRSAIDLGPHAIQYSWGVIVSSNEGPNRTYTAEELGLSRVAHGTPTRSMN